jgi:anti-anti-sigma factor
MTSVFQVIEPTGILDGTKTKDFHHQISKTIETGAQIVLIDFKNVTFMDSSGLGALVKALKTFNAASVQLFLCSINEQIRILFELTSMERYFSICSDREEFEQHLKKQEMVEL